MADSPFGKPPQLPAAPPARRASSRSPDAPGPRARPRRRRLAILLVVAAVILALGGAYVHAFRLAPVVAEKVLILALFSRIPPVQRAAIRALRAHPTKHAAIALVAFINLKNLQQVPDPKKPESPEDRAARRERRLRDLELAERATETLCLLSGQSFGTYFKVERYGHSWGGLSEDKWPRVLLSVDRWALETFAPGAGR